ncbi:hypothetical protein ABZP36_031616 [Zizania latifolia]
MRSCQSTVAGPPPPSPPLTELSPSQPFTDLSPLAASAPIAGLHPPPLVGLHPLLLATPRRSPSVAGPRHIGTARSIGGDQGNRGQELGTGSRLQKQPRSLTKPSSLPVMINQAAPTTKCLAYDDSFICPDSQDVVAASDNNLVPLLEFPDPSDSSTLV